MFGYECNTIYSNHSIIGFSSLWTSTRGIKSAQLQAQKHNHFWPKYCKITMPPMLPLPIVNSSTLAQAGKSSSHQMFWHNSPIICPKSAPIPVHFFPKPALTMLQKQRENRGSSNHEMDHLVCFKSTRTEKVIIRGRAMSSDPGMCEKRNLSSKEDYPDIDDQQFGERFKLPHITDVLDIPPRPSTFCIQSRCIFFNPFSVLSLRVLMSVIYLLGIKNHVLLKVPRIFHN